MALGLDSGIFLAFLVINIFVGLYSARGVKTLKEYAVGDGKFSSMVIAATLVATAVGGSSFTNKISETYANGLYYIWASLGSVVLFFLISWFFAPRMAEFIGKLSIADAMGSIYGDKVKLVTAIFGCIGASGIIAAQLRVAGVIIEYSFNIPSFYGVLIAGIITGVYSSLGGIKSVTFTDIIQLLTFGTIIPTLASVVFFSLNNNDVLLHTIQHNDLFNYKEIFDFTRAKSFEYLLLFLCLAFPAFNPAIFQRIAMASNTLQIKKSFNLAGIASLFIIVTLCFIGFVILSDNPNLSPKDVTKYIYTHYSYVGLRGLILAGIMAMVMSTVDSYVNATSVLISHDVFKSLKIKIMNNDLLFAKLTSSLIAAFALMLAINSKGNLLNFIIATQNFYDPIVSVAFVFAILGFRPSSKAVLISMGFALMTSSVLTIIGHDTIQTYFIAVIISAITLFASHYLLGQPGGWVGIKDMGPLITARQTRRHNFDQFVKNVKNFSVMSFLKRSTPTQDHIYVVLSFFCMIVTYGLIFTLPKHVSERYADVISWVYPSMMFVITALLSQPLWPRFMKESNTIMVVWSGVIFYILVFASLFFTMISDFAPMHLIFLSINLLLVAMLVRWQLFFVMVGLGILAATKFLKIYLGTDFLELNISSIKNEISYMLVLMAGIVVIFLKPKQDSYDLIETKTQVLEDQMEERDDELSRALAIKMQFIRNLGHEIRTPISIITNMSDILYDIYKELTPEKLDSSLWALASSSERLISLVDNMLDLSNLSCENYQLNLAPIDLGELTYEVLEKTKKLYITNQDIEFVTNIEKNVIVNCDSHYMRSTIYNLLINAIKFSKDGKITIDLHRENAKVKFSVQDEGVGIPEMELFTIFKPFVESSRTSTKAGGRGVGLALCRKTIELHKGKIWAESKGEKGATFYFTL